MSRLLPIVIALALLCGCGDADSPEAQVRKTIDAMEEAAERRDSSDLMAFVADDFRGGPGVDNAELRRYLQGYFLANPSLHLLTRIDSLEFPHPDEARLQVTVGSVSREADASSAWNLAADIQQLEATLRLEDGEWKVAYAKWGGSR